MVTAYEFTDLAKKVGVGLNLIKSSESKAGLNYFQKPSPQAEKEAREMIDEVHAQFNEIILLNRKVDSKNLPEIFSGKTFTGEKAFDLGLIDQIGDFDDALEWLHASKGIGKDLPVREIDFSSSTIYSGLGFKAYINNLVEKLFAELLLSAFYKINYI